MSTLGMTIDAFGWFGALILIAAYALISHGSMGGRSVAYQSLNVAGSVLLMVNTAWHHAWPSSAVNLIWVAIAVGALIRGQKTNAADGL